MSDSGSGGGVLCIRWRIFRNLDGLFIRFLRVVVFLSTHPPFPRRNVSAKEWDTPMPKLLNGSRDDPFQNRSVRLFSSTADFIHIQHTVSFFPLAFIDNVGDAWLVPVQYPIAKEGKIDPARFFGCPEIIISFFALGR
jgi:hypothetical protein